MPARFGFEQLAQPRDGGGRQGDAPHKCVIAIDQLNRERA
jgi:hypothetical protein